jgi:hypothetical protein
MRSDPTQRECREELVRYMEDHRMPMLPLIVHTPGVSVLHSPDPIPLGLFVEGHLTMV